MKAPDENNSMLNDPVEEGRLAFLQRFELEDIQTLGREDLLVAQILASHGENWGRWQTPKELGGDRLQKGMREINFAHRLRSYLATEETPISVDVLLDEGVLILTRLALLMRVAPAGGRTCARSYHLKPSTIVQSLYVYLPKITARAISRKAAVYPGTPGLLSYLTDEDIQEFCAYGRTRNELVRLDTLVARGLWSDAPLLPQIERTTNPAQRPAIRRPQGNPEPYLPLPDDWLAEIGPRVLWVIQDLGPNLLNLLEAIPELSKGINWSTTSTNIGYRIRSRIAVYLESHPWLDCAGRPLAPPFRLITSQGGSRLEWPPHTWENIAYLSLILQAAHLFISLLASASRIGEVAALTRGCVTCERDGKEYLRGYTYKLSNNLFGDARQWPAPAILIESLGQQSRFAAAWDWLPNSLNDGLPEVPRFENAMWISIGASGRTGAEAVVDFNVALQALAKRVGMDPRPGGKWVHAHRFRKTIGRLAGVALFNSPMVLKRLFGHKNIEMTLHYIMCDPGIRQEAEKVLRELRIMHCADALEEIHRAIREGLPLPGHGGAGAARLITAVQNHEEHLQQNGRLWRDGSAYDLACLLTGQGRGWRLINTNVVCSKDWVCQKPHRHHELEVGKPKCDPGCTNRVVLARRRRDTELAIEQYLDIARQAEDEGMLLVMAHAMENLREELGFFADLREKYLAMPDVRAMFALCENTEEPVAGDSV